MRKSILGFLRFMGWICVALAVLVILLTAAIIGLDEKNIQTHESLVAHGVQHQRYEALPKKEFVITAAIMVGGFLLLSGIFFGGAKLITKTPDHIFQPDSMRTWYSVK